MLIQEIELAVDLVNEVYAESGMSPLTTIAHARKALIDTGITEQRDIAHILRRSLYANDERLNLLNTLELF